MNAVFDIASAQYDTDFTHSCVGKKQRDRVWSFLLKSKLLDQKLDILEVNCGTGEDALWLASKGHRVLASDISGKMVEVGQHKAAMSNQTNVAFIQAGFHQLEDFKSQGPFDLVFSNFGGLNCISQKDLVKFIHTSHTLLKPTGSIVAVIMPRFCIWESLYYLFKKPSIAFRRLKEKAIAQIGSDELEVFYHSPSQVKKMSEQLFDTIQTAPVGLFLPPSYLEHFFRTRLKALDTLDNWENKLPSSVLLSSLSDHYFIHLKKKQ